MRSSNQRMQRIRFNDEKNHEEGLRVLLVNVPVQFTGIKYQYDVPDHALDLLDKMKISCEFLGPPPKKHSAYQ